VSRIYLVDDHPIVRAGLGAMLQGAGHDVVGGSADIAQALDDVSRLQPDIVVLDLHLDGRSGFEVLAELQRRQQATRVIVLSMSDQPRNVTESLRLGAAGYVLKAAQGTELLAAIETVAKGGRHLGPDLAGIVAGHAGELGRRGTLSPRERQIVVMVASGKSSAAIGEALHLSPKTVDTYRSRLMAKLDLADVPALVRWAIREKLIALED
jgi:two-component system invasion response regulator UvrY